MPRLQLIYSTPRGTHRSVVPHLHGAGRNPRKRGRSPMPLTQRRTWSRHENGGSTNRQRRQHTQREAPRQRAGLRNRGTLRGDIHLYAQTPQPRRNHNSSTTPAQQNHTSPTHLIKTPRPSGSGIPPVERFAGWHGGGGLLLGQQHVGGERSEPEGCIPGGDASSATKEPGGEGWNPWPRSGAA